MKYIELIDKYIIHQNEDMNYNPPSYEWADNMGVLIRCKDCKYADAYNHCGFLNKWTSDNDYCSCAEARK